MSLNHTRSPLYWEEESGGTSFYGDHYARCLQFASGKWTRPSINFAFTARVWGGSGSCKSKKMSNDWKELILQTIQDQNGVIFASPAFVGRGIYAGRGIIAQNTDFDPSMTDNRGYLPVEWWIMSKTVAKNAIPLENEGLTSLIVCGKKVHLTEALQVAETELMGKYSQSWPLTKVLDIGGPARVPKYTSTASEHKDEAEVPPIPCHVHAGEVVKGVCVGPGKTESYFFPPTNVPPYNLKLDRVITRLGIKPGTSQEDFKQSLTKFGINDDIYRLMSIYEINPWETWFIEERIIHAPGPWPTFEIQRPQDDYNLLAWQLGQSVPADELHSTICDHHLKGLKDRESLMDNTIDWESNVDTEFKTNWWKKCERLDEGPWGFKLRLFYRLFYGEGFVIRPGMSYTRGADERPYAGIIWSGEGTINKLVFDMADKEKREFLVTPGSVAVFKNTSDTLDLIVFTVFPLNNQ